MTIAIADDEALFREGIIRILDDYPDLSLAFEAADGQDLLNQLAASQPLPDILLLDLNMPVLNGIEAAKRIGELYPDLNFVVLSSYHTKAFILSMIELGASAYLSKQATPEEMAHTIREVAAKGFYYDEAVITVIRENMAKKARPKQRHSFQVDISEREQQVLQLICEEYTTPEIAKQLFISPRTVEGHRNHLMEKLGCRNVAGLVIAALQQELVHIAPRTF
jgi:DNA-binding NarL/FixJ family response regulator